jgi:hypothetical protein
MPIIWALIAVEDFTEKTTVFENTFHLVFCYAFLTTLSVLLLSPELIYVIWSPDSMRDTEYVSH